jgi:hypothetical protein
MRTWIALWLASLVAVAALTSAMLFAQERFREREYRILSGTDVGFRIEGTDPAGKPIGSWMLRVDGEWVEVGYYPTVRPVN